MKLRIRGWFMWMSSLGYMHQEKKSGSWSSWEAFTKFPGRPPIWNRTLKNFPLLLVCFRCKVAMARLWDISKLPQNARSVEDVEVLVLKAMTLAARDHASRERINNSDNNNNNNTNNTNTQTNKQTNKNNNQQPTTRNNKQLLFGLATTHSLRKCFCKSWRHCPFPCTRQAEWMGYLLQPKRVPPSPYLKKMGAYTLEI